MSRHAQLQRIVVRMQHDPGFAARLHAALQHGVPDELARVGLGEPERRWLASVDARAFRHDPLKRRRLMSGLITELKTASAIALAETRRIALLDGFCASQQFHVAVQYDRSLADAFADFLLAAGLRTPQLADVVRIEAALARCRRELEAAGGVDWRPPPVPERLARVARAPGVAVLRASPDALAAMHKTEQYLFEAALVPALALVDDAPRLELPPPTERPPVALAIVPSGGTMSLVEIDDGLHAALDAAAPPGIDVARIGRELAEGLVDEEVLVAVS